MAPKVRLRVSEFLKESFTTTATIFLTVPFTIVVIAWLPIFALFYIYRTIVSLVAPLVDSDLGKMVTGTSAWFCRDIDTVYVKPKITQVVCFRMNGPFNFSNVRNDILGRIVYKVDTSSGQLHYPELQHYFTTFMGYPFLKKDPYFDGNDHIKHFNPNSSDPFQKCDLIKLWEDLLIKPFSKNKSPWEVLLVDNYKPDAAELETWIRTSGTSKTDNYWLMILRMHHGLGDGFSIQKMFSFLADEIYLPKFSTKVNPWLKVMLNLRTAILGTYDCVYRLMRYYEGYHVLHKPAYEHSNQYFVAESNHISMDRVREIKRKFGVAFTVVLLSAAAGGIRKFLVKNSLPIPKYLSTMIPIASLDHTDKLTNEFLNGTVGLGVHLDDPQERIQYIKHQLTLLGRTAWVKDLDVLLEVLSWMPTRLVKLFTTKCLASSVFSTQPGPVKCLKTMSGQLLEVNYSYGTNTDSIGYNINTLTFNNSFRVVLNIERNLVKCRDKAEELLACIVEEYDVLFHYHECQVATKGIKKDENVFVEGKLVKGD